MTTEDSHGTKDKLVVEPVAVSVVPTTEDSKDKLAVKLVAVPVVPTMAIALDAIGA